ncbi:hypothetical protein FNU79_15400 [Deinococcus detaillensis]|uniref:Uncharacterized protein n=1 Tax=Deinococcus detaillensis TaxID=2592048 RepID=A0A553UMF8_9DEIO|nr:hypothetical protein [Deinococcus detaillensis]TSA81389.1 hypothetical protein FNU79_15400 [Deinococcus detaillensis]
MPAAVQAYLAAATRHLPGRARAVVAAELYANLFQRMLDHSLSLSGETASTEEAWAAALRDFGPPQHTARAFAKVHRWPALIRTALAVLALGSAGYAAARSVHWQALGWPLVQSQSETQSTGSDAPQYTAQ